MSATSCLFGRFTNDIAFTLRSAERGDDRLTEAEVLRAWMRDISGFNGTEAFKTKAHFLENRGAHL